MCCATEDNQSHRRFVFPLFNALPTDDECAAAEGGDSSPSLTPFVLGTAISLAVFHWAQPPHRFFFFLSSFHNARPSFSPAQQQQARVRHIAIPSLISV